jgi:hypothetical protein
MGEFAQGAVAFNPDESVALVRWFARLLAARTPEAGDLFVETLSAVVDAGTRRHKVAEPLACHKGCGSCCHQQVSVAAPEIFAVARGVRRSKALAEHRARLAARPDRKAGEPGRLLDPAKPCAFLKDEACSIHAFRPMVCRAIVSLSKPACLRRFEAGNGGIPYPRPYEAIRHWADTAVWTAHAAAGLEPRTFDFEAGVALLLDDPGREARWYAGDAAALAEAADPPLPPRIGTDIARLRQLARL